MASPTEAEMNTQIQNAVAFLDNQLTQQTLRTDYDTAVAAQENDFSAAHLAAMEAMVDASASSIDAAAVLEPILLAYCRHIVGRDAQDVSEAVEVMRQYFLDNDKQITTATVSIGGITAGGSNTGDGAGFYSILGPDNYHASNSYTLGRSARHDDITWRCIADQNTGADKHRETWEITGEHAARDVLEARTQGTGVSTTITTKNTDDSLMLNPSFSSYSIAGSVSSGSPYTLVSGDTITDWTAGDVTQLQLTVDTADIFMDLPNDATPTALRFNGATYIEQTFETAGIDFERYRPLALFMGAKKENSADGTLTFTIGSQTATQTVSGLGTSMGALLVGTGGLWGSTAAFFNNWPDNFVQNGGKLKIEWGSRTTGEVVIDDVCLVAMDLVAGFPTIIYPGATPFVIGDTFTQTRTVSAWGKIEFWINQALGGFQTEDAPDMRFLPGNLVRTVTADGSPTATFNDNSPSDDTIVLSTGAWDTFYGFEPGMTITVAGTASNDGTYTCASISTTTMTLAAGDALTNEGPLSGSETITGTPSLADPS